MRDILIPERGRWGLVLWKAADDWPTSDPFELVDVEGEFEGGAEL